MEFSPWPARTTRSGPRSTSWRQSSLPMDPPAPVTSTVWPLTMLRTASRLVVTGSRRRRSWISTFRRARMATRPEMMSNMPGTVRVFTLAAAAASRTSRMTTPGALGIAMMTSSMLCFSMMPGSSARDPSTGRLETRLPCLERSSSTKPTGSRPSSGLPRSSRTIMAPAAPAPAMSARWAPLRTPFRRREARSRTAIRGRVKMAPVKNASRTRRESGTRRGARPVAGNHERAHQEAGDAGDHGRREDLLRFVHAGVAPDPAVQAGRQRDTHLDRQGEGDEPGRDECVSRRPGQPLEPDGERRAVWRAGSSSASSARKWRLRRPAGGWALICGVSGVSTWWTTHNIARPCQSVVK